MSLPPPLLSKRGPEGRGGGPAKRASAGPAISLSASVHHDVIHHGVILHPEITVSKLFLPAFGASILLVKHLSDLVGISVVDALTGFVGTTDLSIALTSASVAFFRNGLTNGQSHSSIFAIARNWVVGAC